MYATSLLRQKKWCKKGAMRIKTCLPAGRFGYFLCAKEVALLIAHSFLISPYYFPIS